MSTERLTTVETAGERAGPGRRMRMVTQYSFGGPEVLQVVEADAPSPGPGEALVRVRAASVNYGETNARSGKVPQMGPPPFILGFDLSGTVEAVGEGVTRFRPGDEVFGMKFVGTYAEYVTVPADDLTPKPAGLDHGLAAALPCAGLTAWQALVDIADVRAGQRVLVHAAAGGVGHLAVQIAKLRGAHVIGTARAAKHDFVRGLGADELIDYTATDFTTAVRDVDMVFDLVGGAYGPRSLEVLRPGGLLVGAALDAGVTAEDAERAGRRYVWVGVHPAPRDLAHLADLVLDGRLRVSIQRTFPLEDLPKAHELADSGRVTGKLVITL
ncbi:MAG TPA: NADP-dependent oxidoreductase [Thermomonospora sp.]|nr:NADP-dependent oxidoreductase [Thermomonospora sp.]